MARTISTSLVPIPNASAPNAPCVLVCESPHTIVIPGWVSPSCGPMTWTMPCAGIADAVERDAELGAVALELADLGGGHRVERSAGCAASSGSSGRPWRRSGPAGGRRGPRARSPVNACGLVTSWTRWRSTARTAGAPGSWVTTWSAQILSTMVRGAVGGCRRPMAGSGQARRVPGSWSRDGAERSRGRPRRARAGRAPSGAAWCGSQRAGSAAPRRRRRAAEQVALAQLAAEPAQDAGAAPASRCPRRRSAGRASGRAR